jgi:hypothetical protein
VAELRTLSGHTSSVHAVAVTRTGSACGFCVAGRDAEGVGTGERARVGHLHRPQRSGQGGGSEPGQTTGGLTSSDETPKVWELLAGIWERPGGGKLNALEEFRRVSVAIGKSQH